MKILSNIFNKELPIGSFVIRAFSATLGIFLVLSLLFSLLFSVILYDSIEFLYRETYSIISLIYNFLFPVITNSVVFVVNKIINFKDTYLYQNKLLLSFTFLSILFVSIFYRMINFHKKGYKPYYKKLYIGLDGFESVISLFLLIVLCNHFFDSFNLNSLRLYNRILNGMFLTYIVALPFIFFTIHNKRSSLLFSQFSSFAKKAGKKMFDELEFTLLMLIIIIMPVSLLLSNYLETIKYLFILFIFYIYIIVLLTSIKHKKEILESSTAHHSEVIVVKTFSDYLELKKKYPDQLSVLKINSEKNFYEFTAVSDGKNFIYFNIS